MTKAQKYLLMLVATTLFRLLCVAGHGINRKDLRKAIEDVEEEYFSE